MLGYGPDEGRLRALAKKLCVEEHVAFPGYAENPYAYTGRAAALALSPLFEALPGVLVEALVLGSHSALSPALAGRLTHAGSAVPCRWRV
jgi:glycosyltransferase involved in cell wall biosynthesis